LKEKTKNMPKKNLDLVLVERKLAPDISCAQAYILAGKVTVNNRKADKPGIKISEDAAVDLKKEMPYVSRGGLKIEHAFKDLGLSAAGKNAADIGASTGGFTDYLLQNGAASVTAIDVGYGILSWKLRNDIRVRVLERTNVKNVEKAMLENPADITVADLSFISIKSVFKKILELTREGGEILILIKPQFEALRNEVGKGGIILDPNIHTKVLKELADYITAAGLTIEGITFSKIRGAKGNIEFWFYIKKIFLKTGSNIKNTAGSYDKIIGSVVCEASDFFGIQI
jgi:23S rRNA (cytidine1920-2'-O)/16S rRNA (cytidine1409-2'-O)-methyltransferase